MLDQLCEIEHRLFCRAVQEASRLHAEGDPEAACCCLRAGLERACELLAAGAMDAAELVAAYETAQRTLECLPVRRRAAPAQVSEGEARSWGVFAGSGTAAAQGPASRFRSVIRS